MGSDIADYKVMVMPEARDNLDGIYAYIRGKLQSPGIAVETNRRLRKAIASLQQFPGRGAVTEVKFADSVEIRFIPAGNYDVYYTVKEDLLEVHVLAVAYSHRDIANVFGQGMSIVCDGSNIYNRCGNCK